MEASLKSPNAAQPSNKVDLPPDKEEERNSFKDDCSNFYNKLQLHRCFGAVVLIIYTLTGALTFIGIEQEYDRDKRTRIMSEVNSSRLSFITNIRESIAMEAMNPVPESNDFFDPDEMLLRRVKSYEHSINCTFIHDSPWTYGSALFYVMSLYTTIGYGTIVCETSFGRIMSMVYAIIGVPLMVSVLSEIGSVLLSVLVMFTRACGGLASKLVCWRWQFWMNRKKKKLTVVEVDDNERRTTCGDITIVVDPEEPEEQPNGNLVENELFPEDEEEEDDDQSFIVVVVATFGYLAATASIISAWEQWDYLSSYYFMFISVSTIGFGDLVPSNSSTGGIISILSLVGMGLVTVCISVAQTSVQKLYLRLLRAVLRRYIRALELGGTDEGAALDLQHKWKNDFRFKLASMFLSKGNRELVMKKLEKEAREQGIELPGLLTELDGSGMPSILHQPVDKVQEDINRRASTLLPRPSLLPGYYGMPPVVPTEEAECQTDFEILERLESLVHVASTLASLEADEQEAEQALAYVLRQIKTSSTSPTMTTTLNLLRTIQTDKAVGSDIPKSTESVSVQTFRMKQPVDTKAEHEHTAKEVHEHTERCEHCIAIMAANTAEAKSRLGLLESVETEIEKISRRTDAIHEQLTELTVKKRVRIQEEEDVQQSSSMQEDANMEPLSEALADQALMLAIADLENEDSGHSSPESSSRKAHDLDAILEQKIQNHVVGHSHAELRRNQSCHFCVDDAASVHSNEDTTDEDDVEFLFSLKNQANQTAVTVPPSIDQASQYELVQESVACQYQVETVDLSTQIDEIEYVDSEVQYGEEVETRSLCVFTDPNEISSDFCVQNSPDIAEVTVEAVVASVDGSVQAQPDCVMSSSQTEVELNDDACQTAPCLEHCILEHIEITPCDMQSLSSQTDTFLLYSDTGMQSEELLLPSASTQLSDSDFDERMDVDTQTADNALCYDINLTEMCFLHHCDMFSCLLQTVKLLTPTRDASTEAELRKTAAVRQAPATETKDAVVFAITYSPHESELLSSDVEVQTVQSQLVGSAVLKYRPTLQQNGDGVFTMNGEVDPVRISSPVVPPSTQSQETALIIGHDQRKPAVHVKLERFKRQKSVKQLNRTAWSLLAADVQKDTGPNDYMRQRLQLRRHFQSQSDLDDRKKSNRLEYSIYDGLHVERQKSVKALKKEFESKGGGLKLPGQFMSQSMSSLHTW